MIRIGVLKRIILPGISNDIQRYAKQGAIITDL
ncbi:Uncharacterised protein [Paenibacillus macerans]|nr:Uncharacterised protein [Paenibacillus macerans]